MDKSLLKELLPQVKRNCLISDAGYWGYYSTCGLLLRLREQYRFEEGIQPGIQVDIKKVGPWIEKREQQWQQLEGLPFNDIILNGNNYEPFDSTGINSAIKNAKLVYGGGYGVYMKPVFFLAELRSSSRLGPYNVLVADRELARDLSIHPAMSRESTIIARSDMAYAMICDRFEEYRASKRPGNLAKAFKGYGIGPEAEASSIRKVADTEMETFIHHEFGELKETRRLGHEWAELVRALGTSRTGLELRGAKDALADTAECGMLSHIISEKKTGSLFFYIAALTGIRYTLASPIRDVVKDSSGYVDWNAMEEARRESYRKAVSVTGQSLEAYRSAPRGKLEEYIQAIFARACPVNP